MKRILVTGSNGFLGRQVVPMLLNRGFFVLGLSRSITNFSHPNFKSVQIDLTNRIMMNSIESFDVIIHLAGAVSAAQSLIDPLSCVQNNILATANILDLYRLRGGEGMIYISSGKIYPIEDGISRSPYGATKLCADLLVQEFQKSYKMSISIIRFTGFYGPTIKPPIYPDQSWINWFCYLNTIGGEITLYGEGVQERNPIYISDAASLILKIIENRKYSLLTDVGGGLRNKTSPAKVIEIIQKLSNKKFLKINKKPLRSDMQENFIASNKDVASFWNPKIELEEGILNTLNNLGKKFEN
jgi:nucleoside-diphosphate-sugar epimerase